MKTLEGIQQGSAEWLAHRRAHFNASDAPAMMGVSPYKTRTDLMHELHTGMAPEVDAATQRRFDDGHRFEALARRLAEEIIGEELYPVVGFDGRLSASFDGITMLEDVIWEHKTLSDRIRAAKSASELPKDLRIQMEQQLHVSGAEKCLFMATLWSGDVLVEEVHHWYMPDLEARERIVGNWAQFETDLAAYVPREIVEKPQSEAIMDLPALIIQVKGEVTTSNLPSFKAAAEQFIASINTDLQTDTDFSNAEATVKFCTTAEKDLEQAKKSAIGQMSSVDELVRTIDHIQAQLRDKRLMLDKAVKTQKEVIKSKVVMDAQQAFKNHCAQLDDELRGHGVCLVMPYPAFAEAAKNKRTLASLHDAVDTELAKWKIEADSVAQSVRAKVRWFKENGGSQSMFLFSDLQDIAYKAEDDFKLLVTTRINNHKQAELAKEEAARARIQAEEQAKTEAKVKAEQEAKTEEEANELARNLAESHAKQLSESLAEAIIIVNEEKPAPTQATTLKLVRPVPIIIDRPTDAEIIGALAVRFAVSEQTVKNWLADMNLEVAA